MTDARRTTVSKYLSKHLRHAPGAIGLTLGEGGWVPIEALLSAASDNGFRITRDELDEVVRLCAKQRFAVDLERQLIRANQGHSVEVDLALEPVPPPPQLYHGTATRFREPILASGLRKMSRQHVHLSADVETAIAVGRRHGKPLVFQVDTMSMSRDGIVFYRAANGVWLTDHVPPLYLRELPQE
jgi:putative RNA 2'-phosphotransferase